MSSQNRSQTSCVEERLNKSLHLRSETKIDIDLVTLYGKSGGGVPFWVGFWIALSLRVRMLTEEYIGRPMYDGGIASMTPVLFQLMVQTMLLCSVIHRRAFLLVHVFVQFPAFSSHHSNSELFHIMYLYSPFKLATSY